MMFVIQKGMYENFETTQLIWTKTVTQHLVVHYDVSVKQIKIKRTRNRKAHESMINLFERDITVCYLVNENGV